MLTLPLSVGLIVIWVIALRVVVLRVQISRHVEELHDLRSWQSRRLVAAPPRCRHSLPPVPVEVHDTLDGHPEVVCWLCPSCLEETRPPPPRGPGSVPGLTTQQAGENLTRALRGC